MKNRHEGIVTIEPLPSSSQIPRIYEGVKQSISPEYNDLGIVVTGISREEEDLYLPEVLNMEVTEFGYRKAVKIFWKNFALVMTGGETTLDLSNTKHYLQYRLALVSKHVINPGCTREDFPFANFALKDELIEAKHNSKVKDKIFEAYGVIHDMSQEEKTDFYKSC